ncbi:MAG: hypothetical protein LBL58_10805, partial [Tannerellaceae bacterium]|nr:hypothetical protein [Tannerellaceae bacterium]
MKSHPYISRTIIFFVFSLVCRLGLAQATYPVQVFTHLIPPYTPHVTEYYSGGREKLRVTLVNTDMQEPLLNVYLKMK